MTTEYISVADTAKLVRAALKAAFPAIKFSVRSDSYSGGASILVKWTDGPTEKEVKKITDEFEGSTFDGMIDLKSSVTRTVNGVRVRYGADYVHTSRELSDTMKMKVATQVYKTYGKRVKFRLTQYGYEAIADYTDAIAPGFTAVDAMYRIAREMSA